MLSMTRLLRNLIDNALKYGGEELTEIRIGYQEAERSHVLSVTDDGIGIKDEDSEEIFEPFIRKSTSRGIEGSGIGLAIVREIAEKHGGRVWTEPGREVGITFLVFLPK
jgi:signal transduction histidine kinase